MSLINEALKKAQKQRTGDTPSLTAMPAIGGESAARIARRGKPAGFNTLLLRLGLGVVVAVVLIVGTVFVLRRPAAPAPVSTPALGTPPVSAAVPAPAPVISLSPAPGPITPITTSEPSLPPSSTVASNPAPAPVIPVMATPNSAPVHMTPAVPAAVAPDLSPAPVSTAMTVLPPPIELPKPVAITPIPLPPEPARPGAVRKLEPRAINFINSIRVAGIRASASDSKVLMNDRVYRVGDTVEAEMGLKLAGITASSLTFEDENGGRFTRTF